MTADLHETPIWRRRLRRWPGPIALLVAGAALWHAAALVPGAPFLIDLGGLGGGRSEAADLNDHGQIVGRSVTPSGKWHAFLWEKGRMHDLDAPPGRSSAATAINNRGRIIGSYGWGEAVVWEPGRVNILPPLPGHGGTEAHDINDRGQIAGTSHSKRGSRAVLWEDGRVVDADREAGRPAGTTLWCATAINNRGQVAGLAAGGAESVFTWEPGRASVPLDVGRDKRGYESSQVVSVTIGDDDTLLLHRRQSDGIVFAWPPLPFRPYSFCRDGRVQELPDVAGKPLDPVCMSQNGRVFTVVTDLSGTKCPAILSGDEWVRLRSPRPFGCWRTVPTPAGSWPICWTDEIAAANNRGQILIHIGPRAFLLTCLPMK